MELSLGRLLGAAASGAARHRALKASRPRLLARFRASPLAPICRASAGVVNTHFHLSEDALRVARSEGPVGAYGWLTDRGVLLKSSDQERVMHILSVIFHGLKGGKSVKGLYIHGSVGSGKSMAMDLFFACASSDQGRCQRMHFHEFMHMVHRMAHQAKTKFPGQRPVDAVARQVVEEMGILLCFDEMAITTIQDCCLLTPLFEAMWQAGIVTVMTSNRAPEDLYSGGLNRHIYLPPFVDALRSHCKVVPLVSETDYRQEQVARSGVAEEAVFCERGSERFARDWWSKATSGAPMRRERFEGGYGRYLEVCGHGGVALTSFKDMCSSMRSVEDYHALCRRYHTVILEGIPVMNADSHNEARRFTNFIDATYEAHVRLVASFDEPLTRVLAGLTPLRDVGDDEVGHAVGCGDGDTSPSSSGVLEAVARMKAAVEHGPSQQEVMDTVFPGGPRARGGREAGSGAPVQDMEIWTQKGGGNAPPQVSKQWDDRRRTTSFSWEAGDPTAEQQTIKGVFAAAVASLKETGFASARTESRLREMQSNAYLREWEAKRRPGTGAP